MRSSDVWKAEIAALKRVGLFIIAVVVVWGGIALLKESGAGIGLIGAALALFGSMPWLLILLAVGVVALVVIAARLIDFR